MSKVETLRSLVEEYVQHLNLWEKVSVTEITRDKVYQVTEVTIEDKYGHKTQEVVTEERDAKGTPFIEIKYYSPKPSYKGILHPNGFEAREFPLEEIDRRIIHYRNKLYNLKKKADE